MEHFKSTEAGSIDQKENDPSLARDKNDGITKQSAKLNFTQQVAVPQLPQSQQPLRTRNMTTQSQTQTELLEKFRKLRQWQQQQQESMLRQQQQAMETLKMEQSQLQSILAAQRKLQEQQNISSLTVRSPLSEEDAKRTSPLIVQSQSQQMPRTQNVSSEFVGQVTTDLHKAIHTSSLLPVSSSSATSLNLGELSSRIQENEGLVNSQKPNESSRPQVVVNEEQRLDGSITSFNATVYPMMWNSPNYCLPSGATSLSTGTRLMHLQGKPVVSSGSPMPNLESSTKGMHEVAQGYQMLSSSEELEQLRKYHFTTEIQSHLEMCDENDKEKDYVPVMLPQQLPLQRLWSRNPGVQLLASVETNADEQSEADAMSGVYPLYDSESEVGVNELGDDRSGDEEVDADYDNGEEFEESNERDKTVIDLHSLPVESERKTEQPQGGSKTEVNEEMRPIKPGIGGESFVKTFEELLEQQLKLDEASKPVTGPEATNQIPQRTFLRKGQGLARFKGKSTSNKTVGQPRGYASQLTAVGQKKEKKTGNPESSFPEGNNKLTVQNGVREMQGKVTRKVASKSPQLATEASQETAPGRRLQSKGSSGPKTQSPSIGEIMVTTTGNQPIPVSQSGVFTRAEAMSNPSGLLNSIDASFQMRLQELEEKQEMEYEELEEFELLEQAAANASFSSNSSVVVKVLAKARGNALGGKSVIQGQNGTNNRGPRGILSPVDTGYGSGDGKVTSSAAVDHPELNHVNAVHDNDSENEEDDVTLQEMSLDSALELDHGAESKYDTAINNQQKGPVHLNPTSPSPFAIEEDFNDEEAWGEIKKQAEANTKKDKKNDDDDDDFYEDDDDSDVTISDIFPLITSTPPAHLKGGDAQEHERAVDSRVDGMTALTPPTSALVTKLFPQLKPKMKPSAGTKQSVSEQVPQNRPGEGKVEESSEAVQSIAVRQKLKQLETEIDKFRGENAALAKMRAEREEGLKKLQTEIAAFEKQKTEELERLEQFREEELRKLRRERRVFEKYQKAARTIPDKKEREEIEALRAQVAELQDELKRRETRWSAASTRSRQKIEALEQEKKELQDDIKLLEQYRLQQWREDEQTREEEETGHQKPLQRKIAKTTEEDSGTRLLPTRRSPPLRSEESVLWSTPEDAVIGPENRLTRLGVEANNNQSGVPRRGEKPSPDTFPELNDERSEIASMNTTERNDIVETQRSKRSPRQRSETPNSSEKVKRSVHFRDEDTLQHSIPAEGDSLIEKIGRQDQREIMHSDGKVEKVNSDGSRVIAFANGTRKDISADGQTIIVTFFNGDVKQIMPDQRVIYYYSEAQTTHTTYADGLEVLQFPSKQIEKHYPNGTKEIIFPDQTIKYLHPNGAEECVFSDGTIQKVGVDGERTIEFPNGQRETHTKYYKKREYPDGTVKTVYPDGRTETRYATGRVRVKDWDGRVLVDSQSNQMR